MSVVSGVFLMVHCAENGIDPADEYSRKALVVELDEWLTERRRLPLVDVTKHSYLGKHPQVIFYVGGYNYFPEDEFADQVLSKKWQYPESVVLVINPEDGSARVWRAAE